MENGLKMIPGADDIVELQAQREFHRHDGLAGAYDRLILHELSYLYIQPTDDRIKELCWRVLYKGEDPEDIAAEPRFRVIGAQGVRVLVGYGLEIIEERRLPCGGYKHKTAAELEYIAERRHLCRQLEQTWKAYTRAEDAAAEKRAQERDKRLAKLAAIERNLRAKQGR